MTAIRINILPFLLCSMALLSWTIPLSAEAQGDIVKFGANESPPYWSKSLPEDGMCGEIIHAISREVGLQSVIEYIPLRRLIADPGNNDLGNPVFYLGHQDYGSIIPIALYQAAFFYYRPHHKENITLQRQEDLKNYTVGTLRGTLLDRLYFAGKGVIFEESSSQESLIKKLKLGRIDLYLEINLVGQQIIRKHFPGEVNDFGSITIAQSTAPIAIMLAEEYPNGKGVADKYRDGLAKIINNGRYEKILEKYYGKGKIPRNWFQKLERFDQIYNFEERE